MISMKYTIKPLEWERVHHGVYVQTVFGLYVAFTNSSHDWWVVNPEGFASQPYKTAAEAKAAAETQYRQRLMPALVGEQETQ